MSWIEKLYETYNACSGNESIPDVDELCPVGYSKQKSHVEIVVDGEGNFRRASLVDKNSPPILIPVTEKSLTGRTSGIAPYPLCDNLQYCAGDYKVYGGERESYFEQYFSQLEQWATSKHIHPKVQSICKYVARKTIIQDLQPLLCFDGEKLAVSRKRVTADYDSAPVMKLLNFDGNDVKDQAKVFVRWVVEIDNNVCSQTWKDPTLFDSWGKYINTLETSTGFCCVTGTNTVISDLHPTIIGKAKLVSSNDSSGFTYRGRFITANEAVTLSTEVSQKAHSALKWLIGRDQAFRSGDQVFISWAVAGKPVPNLCANSYDFLGLDTDNNEQSSQYSGDVGQSFSTRLNKKIAGYKASITDTKDIVVMGLDSATPGRMAITFYRELSGSEFLERIEEWHSLYAWYQKYSSDVQFVGVAAPKEIAWAAFGTKVEGKNGTKLLNATIKRILPCIVDGNKIQYDLIESSVNRAKNRVGLKDWEWEKCLGIACSLYKGFYRERGYLMALEEDRTTRDYLFGRLLAIADCLEGFALSQPEKGRPTNAARLMQRFADHPCSTWRTIEMQLSPYRARLGAKATKYEKELQSVMELFNADDFAKDIHLTGEFLLGFHTQRNKLMKKNDHNQEEEEVKS